MADTKITGLTALTSSDMADLLAIVDDPAGTPVTKKITLANLFPNGTWTPTATAVASVDATVGQVSQYVRIGNIVIASGRITIDPTTIGVLTRVRITLPVASSLSGTEGLAGTISQPNDNVSGSCVPDATNDQAELQFVAVSNTNKSYYFIFQYRVL